VVLMQLSHAGRQTTRTITWSRHGSRGAEIMATLRKSSSLTRHPPMQSVTPSPLMPSTRTTDLVLPCLLPLLQRPASPQRPGHAHARRRSLWTCRREGRRSSRDDERCLPRAHPERFPHGPPTPRMPPTEVWINKPIPPAKEQHETKLVALQTSRILVSNLSTISG